MYFLVQIASSLHNKHIAVLDSDLQLNWLGI